MTFALTGSDTQGIINLRNLLSRIALVVEPGQSAALTIQLDLMQPAPEPSLIYLDAFDSEIDVEILKWLSYHPLLTPALQRNTGQVATAELIRLVYPESLRQAVHTQTYVALATWVKRQTSAPSVESPLAGFSTVSSARRKTLGRIAFWIIQKLAKYAGVTFPFACILLAMAPLVAQERVDPPLGAGVGGGNVNLTQIGGVNVGANNGLYVRPGTGAQFDVNVLNATLAVTQSGTWSVRSLDGAGNSLTSRAAGAARALDIAIVDGSGNQVTSFGSGTQYAAGTTQATPTGTVSLGKDSGDVLRALRTNTSGQAEIICVSGCTAGGSFLDNSAFSAGATAISNTGGVFDDGLAAVTSGNGAAARITASRGLHVNIRNASGTEIGTAGAPIRTDPTGSTTQPVSGTVTVGTFPDNEPFNLAQLGGNSVSTGNGTADTGTLRVSIASDSTGSLSATQSGTWSVRTQDGSGNSISSTGGSINVNCTGGCSSPTVEQTWSAGVVSSASAASKDYLTVFNASGSGKILKVIKIRIASSNTAAIAGVGFSGIFSRVTGNGSTCTTVTPVPFDTNNTPLPAQVTANTNCTNDATGLSELGSCGINSDETAAVQQADCFNSNVSGSQPIFLREGQGITIKNTALAPVGLMSVFVDFTVI